MCRRAADAWKKPETNPGRIDRRVICEFSGKIWYPRSESLIASASISEGCGQYGAKGIQHDRDCRCSTTVSTWRYDPSHFPVDRDRSGHRAEVSSDG
jgi:hypothetical protein